MKLSVRDLGKSFGRKVVLRGVDLELEKGQAVCITGPNGAGKSTLIKILSTLLRPDRGEIRMDGENPFENPRIFRRRMGVVLHEPMLYPQLTARENLEYVCRIYGVDGKKAEEWLERVGLSEFAEERVEHLSEGMKQRLAIGRAMIHSPELLLLDEPFASLDARGVEMVIGLITEQVSRGGAAVITSHMSGLLEGVVSRTFQLQDGRLV
ncbi:heme ABC exporter ATP-binding protein CcmA [Candidatus Poribacteria bacterium]|nr:MAG: heme ABC exporter ATP-binding protein CcmA [Candidatus Poribacteria bacterium]